MLRLTAALLALACVALAGCSSSSSSSTTSGSTSDATHFSLTDNRYTPATSTFKADQTGHFKNDGTRDHAVVIHDPAGHVIHDKVLKPGESDEFKFTSPGDYHVFCRFHNGMATEVTIT